MFYDADEIESVKEEQQQDAFTELLEQRHEAVIGFVGQTKIDIASMAPKENELLKNQSNKSKRGKSRNGKSMKSSQTGEHFDEFKANEEEVDTALQLEIQRQKQSEEIIIKQSEAINDQLQAQIQELLIASG